MYEHAGYGGAYKCIEPTERAEWPWLAGIAYDNSRKTLASPIGISDNNISSLKFEGEGRTTFWSRGNFGGWTWRRDAPSTVWDLSQGYGSGANPNDRFQAALFEPVITVLNKDLAALLPASARTFRISGTYSGAGGVQGVWMQQDEGPANCPPTLQSQPGVSGAGSGNRGAVGIRVETFDPKIARPIKARSPG